MLISSSEIIEALHGQDKEFAERLLASAPMKINARFIVDKVCSGRRGALKLLLHFGMEGYIAACQSFARGCVPGRTVVHVLEAFDLEHVAMLTEILRYEESLKSNPLIGYVLRLARKILPGDVGVSVIESSIKSDYQYRRAMALAQLISAMRCDDKLVQAAAYNILLNHEAYVLNACDSLDKFEYESAIICCSIIASANSINAILRIGNDPALRRRQIFAISSYFSRFNVSGDAMIIELMHGGLFLNELIEILDTGQLEEAGEAMEVILAFDLHRTPFVLKVLEKEHVKKNWHVQHAIETNIREISSGIF